MMGGILAFKRMTLSSQASIFKLAAQGQGRDLIQLVHVQLRRLGIRAFSQGSPVGRRSESPSLGVLSAVSCFERASSWDEEQARLR